MPNNKTPLELRHQLLADMTKTTSHTEEKNAKAPAAKAPAAKAPAAKAPAAKAPAAKAPAAKAPAAKIVEEGWVYYVCGVCSKTGLDIWVAEEVE